MGKRKLTSQQSLRIKKIQEKRAKHVKQKEKSIPELSTSFNSAITTEKYSADQQGLVIAHYGSRIDVEPVTEKNHSYRCYLRTNLPPLVTGDYVIWHKDDNNMGIVVARCPRHNELCRPDKHGQLRSVAANVDHIMIVISPVPRLHNTLLDRYLIIAEAANIEPVILFNKTDLLTESNRNETESILSLYQSIGYKIVKTSAYTKEGTDELKKVLNKHTSIFMGQSGVGKSSLINILFPDAKLKTGELSVGRDKGRHTTTASHLFNLSCGGRLIDSPGINEFSLSHMNIDQILYGFREFRPFIGHCKFSNCSHSHEPFCALLTGLKEGKINERRLSSYRTIIRSL